MEVIPCIRNGERNQEDLGSCMKNNEKMIRWLLDAIDTEIAKPDGEADMALVEECTALLGELNGTACTLSERELEKRCREITRGKAVGSKSVKKRVRMVAAVAACLAAFVVISGCGYLPSITTVLQTLFASGIGKDVEVHEVTYTFEGLSKHYDNIEQLIAEEKLGILIPSVLPPNTHITKVLQSAELNNICLLFNDPSISFHVFLCRDIEDFVTLADCTEIIGEKHKIYQRNISNNSHAYYIEFDRNVYYVQSSSSEVSVEIINNLR